MFKKKNLAAIPIQICEIRFTEKLQENKDYEKQIFDLAVRAKAKPVDCNETILLMNLNSDCHWQSEDVGNFPV